MVGGFLGKNISMGDSMFKISKDKTLCPDESAILMSLIQEGDSKVHYCPDSGFRAISQETPEFTSCLCYKIGFKP